MHHPVIARAQALSRRIYASFPWGYRVANLLLKLASGYIDAFGRLVYAEMIKAGVTDMPVPPNGAPVEYYKDKLHGPKGPDMLPRGYGHELGKKIYAMLMAKTRDIEITEETMSRVMVNIARGKLHFKDGFDYKSSEGLVFQAATHVMIDVIRERKIRPYDYKGDSFVPRDDESEDSIRVELSDPNAFKHLDNMIPQSEMHRIIREIEQVNPRAVEWFEAKLEGLTSQELADQWGVSAPRVSQLEALFMPKVKAILMKYLKDAA